MARGNAFIYLKYRLLSVRNFLKTDPVFLIEICILALILSLIIIHNLWVKYGDIEINGGEIELYKYILTIILSFYLIALFPANIIVFKTLFRSDDNLLLCSLPIKASELFYTKYWLCLAKNLWIPGLSSLSIIPFNVRHPFFPIKIPITIFLLFFGEVVIVTLSFLLILFAASALYRVKIKSKLLLLSPVIGYFFGLVIVIKKLAFPPQQFVLSNFLSFGLLLIELYFALTIFSIKLLKSTFGDFWALYSKSAYYRRSSRARIEGGAIKKILFFIPHAGIKGLVIKDLKLQLRKFKSTIFLLGTMAIVLFIIYKNLSTKQAVSAIFLTNLVFLFFQSNIAFSQMQKIYEPVVILKTLSLKPMEIYKAKFISVFFTPVYFHMCFISVSYSKTLSIT